MKKHGQDFNTRGCRVFKKNVNPFTQKIQVSFSKALRKKKLIEICKRSPKEVSLEWTP